MSEKSMKAEIEQNVSGSREELVKLLGEFSTAILVTRDLDGLPRARPLSIVRVEPSGAIWLATASHSPKVLERDGSVAVICHRTRDEAWVSISGRVTIHRDPEKARELWDNQMRAWFEGPDDPALALLRIDPVHAEYYEPTKPFLVRPFERLKGMLTNEPPRLGTTKHVALDRLSDPGRLSG